MCVCINNYIYIDLGITLQTNLKPGLHCTDIERKACARVNLTKRSFVSRDAKKFTRAFLVYVRPILEYCTHAWNLCNKCDIDTIENVQFTFLRRMFSRCRFPPAPYDKRLAYLGLQRLEFRRLLILMYKIIHQSICSNLYHVIHFA